jgi:hypothetical protein
MTTPNKPEAPVTPRHVGFVTWVEEHAIPGMREAAIDAEKARKALPLILEFLPKLTALASKDPALAAKLGPLLAEAEQILTVVSAL